MSNKNIIKLINEEISDFDFLGNDAEQKIQDINDKLKNQDLQKQFIIDSLVDNSGKIKINKIDESKIGGSFEKDSESASYLNIEYSLEIKYKYDSSKDAIIFNLNFESDDISSNDGGEPNWNDIDVSLITKEGNEVEFNALKKAPQKIQVLFIKKYIAEDIGIYLKKIK